MTDTRPVTSEHESSGPGVRAGRGSRFKGLLGRFGLFYRQVVAELRKVIWPTRKELVTYTYVVLIFVLIMIGFVSLCDYGFSKGILKVFG